MQHGMGPNHASMALSGVSSQGPSKQSGVYLWRVDKANRARRVEEMQLQGACVSDGGSTACSGAIGERGPPSNRRVSHARTTAVVSH